MVCAAETQKSTGQVIKTFSAAWNICPETLLHWFWMVASVENGETKPVEIFMRLSLR